MMSDRVLVACAAGTVVASGLAALVAVWAYKVLTDIVLVTGFFAALVGGSV